MTELEKIKIISEAAKNNGLAYYNTIKELLHFICLNFQLTESFIREYQDLITWKEISSYQECSDTNFLREFKDKIDWERVTGYGKTSLTTKQLKLFKDYIPKRLRRNDI